MEKNKNNFFSNLKFDIPAGLVVFFVALPLCLGISLASTSYSGVENMEDFAGIVLPGLIAGIIGGIVVGSFSGSKFGVSGPAAGLITIVSAAIIEFGGFGNGGFEKFAMAVALGGVIQFLLGVIKAGFVAYYIPFSVIKGMLAGIGITIFIKELPHFFGYDKDPEGDLVFQQVDGENTFSELLNAFDNIHIGATIVAIISIIILIVWGMKFVKQNKVLSLIPGPLLAILISIGVAALLGGEYIIGGDHLVQVPNNFAEIKGSMLSPIYSEAKGFHLPDFTLLGDAAIWKVAVVVALVASIESLLCVEATDKMDPNKGRTPMNRELRAQGLGNLFSGLLGGLPITQVIVRSTANIGANAKSKSSAVIHGIFLLVFILAIPFVLNMIPRATLAAVLLLIGWKLASPKSIIAMIKAGWQQFIPFFVVIAVMLTTDLLKGVGAGLVVAFIILLIKNFRVAYFIKAQDLGDDHDRSVMKSFHDKAVKEGAVELILTAHANFLNKASIMKTLDEIKDGEKVYINLSRNMDMDYDIKEAINDFIAGAPDREITVEVSHPEKLEQVSLGH